MRAVVELTIPKQEIRSALSGDLPALENILFNRQFDAATCLYIHQEAALSVSGHERVAAKLRARGVFNNDMVVIHHSSLTLLGHLKMKAMLGADNGYDQKAGLACIERAAKAGNPWAMYLAANCYRLGTACVIDKAKSQAYYLRAARILHNKQRIQDEFVQLVANGRGLDPFRYYLAHMVYAQNPAALAQRYVDNTPLLKEFVCITYSNEDPIFTEELKPVYATALCRLESIATENNSAFLFAWGMMYAELADRMLLRKGIPEFEAARQLARECLERMPQLNGQPNHANHVAALTNRIRRVAYNAIESTTDFTDTKKGAAGLIALQNIACDAAGWFLLAKLLMQYDTDDIFMNRKDKYRLVLHYLSQVEVQDRELCEGYNDFLLTTIAQLQGIKLASCAELLLDVLVVKFDAIASEVMGYPVVFPIQDGKILYTPEIETQMVVTEANHKKLVARFTAVNLKSFEHILYSSYADNKAALDIAYLINKLKTKLRSQLELLAAPSTEIEIVLGDHQLSKAREFERQQRELKIAQIPRALALRAIEKAVPEYEAAKKQHDYRLMAWIKSGNDEARSEDAKKFFTACKLINDEVELMDAIVKHITQAKGRFDEQSFKTFLLRHLAEALNFGNIRLLDNTDTAQFSLYFCESLRQQYLAPPVPAPAQGNDLDLGVDASLPLGAVPAPLLPLADPLHLDPAAQAPLLAQADPLLLDPADQAPPVPSPFPGDTDLDQGEGYKIH